MPLDIPYDAWMVSLDTRIEEETFLHICFGASRYMDVWMVSL